MQSILLLLVLKLSASGGIWVSLIAIQALMVMATESSGHAPFGEEIVAPLHRASSLPQSPSEDCSVYHTNSGVSRAFIWAGSLVQTRPRLHLYTFPPIALLPCVLARVGGIDLGYC